MPSQARSCHVFPSMKDKVLISLGKLCDNGMEAHLTKKDMLMTEEETEKEIMRGKRNRTNGMWYLNITNSDVPSNTFNRKHLVNSVYELKKQKDIITYLSQAMWNPVPDTWVKAIKAGFFATWPGLTDQLVSKHYKRTPETEKGHVKADMQGVRSTKKLKNQITAIEETPSEPIEEAPSEPRVNEFYLKTIDLTGKLCSDQTGRFPVTSIRGNKHVMILCDHDSNAILARPIKTKSAQEQLKNIQEVIKFLNDRGVHPKFTSWTMSVRQ